MLCVAFHSATDVEIFWTLLAGIGALFSAINIGSAWKDVRFYKRQKVVNGRAYLSRNALITEACRFAIQDIFLLIGIGAMFIDNPSQQAGVPLKLRLFGILVQWGLITSSALLTFKTILLYHTRKVLKTKVEDSK